MKKISILACMVPVLTLCSTAARAASVEDDWAQNCAACHGKDGGGHTKAGRMAGVKDMTDAQYQKSFTDDQAFQQIKQGLKDASGKEKMKAFGDTFSDDAIKALVTHVRALQKK